MPPAKLTFSSNNKNQLKTTAPDNMTCTPYPSFSYLTPNQNPENYVLINGRYYFNDYDRDGSYLRRQFGN